MQNWRKNLVVMWICQFLAMVGMSSIVPFLPLFIRELGVETVEGTANWSGLVFAAPFFVSFFLAPVWGNLGDKYGRKLMALRAVFGLAAAQILVGFTQDVTQLFIARMLQGALSGFLSAAMALIASNTPKEKTSYALGVLQSSTAAGTVIGPLIGGVISDFIGFREVFFIVSFLLILVGFAIVLFVKEEKIDPSEKRSSLLDNFKFVISNKPIFYASILITLTALGISFIRPIFVLYVETLQIKGKYLPTITGALYSLVGIFSTYAAYFWGKRATKKSLATNIVQASLLTALMYSLHWVIVDPYLLIPVRVLLGFGYGGLMPLLFTSISNRVSFERKGGVLGVASSFQILGNMSGPLLGGFSAGLLGVRFSFVMAGLIFLILAVITLFKIKD